MIFLALITTFIFVVLVGLAFFVPNAYAYIDPGTGSYVLQVLFAAFVGGLLSFKIFYTRIKGVIGRLLGKGEATKVNQDIKPKKS